MTERHAVAARRQPGDQIEPAVELRRQRDDADVRRRPLDLPQDVRPVECLACSVVSAPACPARPLPCPPCHVQRRARSCAGTDGLRAAYSGLMKLLSRCAGSTRAAPRLRLAARPGDLLEHPTQRRRRAGDGRRTERRDAVPRQPRRHRGNRSPSSSESTPSTPWTCTSMNPERCSGRERRTPRRLPGRRPAGFRRCDRRRWTSVPGERMRSGSTSSAPDRTIIRASASPVGVDVQLAVPSRGSAAAPPCTASRAEHRAGRPGSEQREQLRARRAR